MLIIRIYFIVLRSRQPKETTARTHDVYPYAAGRVGNAVCQDAVSGHIHARRGGTEDQFARV